MAMLEGSIVPAAATVELRDLGAYHFYAVVIPERDRRHGVVYSAWIFCEDVGHALMSFGVPAEGDTSPVSINGIRSLDETGYFDDLKMKLAVMGGAGG